MCTTVGQGLRADQVSDTDLGLEKVKQVLNEEELDQEGDSIYISKSRKLVGSSRSPYLALASSY